MESRARIVVLAGVNGAGKSSVAGEALRQAGADYLNPDEATRRLLEDNPALSPEAANSLARQVGRDRLVEAIRSGRRHAFETTLGGHTITALLLDAARAGSRDPHFLRGPRHRRAAHRPREGPRPARRTRYPRRAHPGPLPEQRGPFLCESHVGQHPCAEDLDELSPVGNSPRMGVCGYGLVD